MSKDRENLKYNLGTLVFSLVMALIFCLIFPAAQTMLEIEKYQELINFIIIFSIFVVGTIVGKILSGLIKSS